MKSILQTCVPRDDLLKGTFNPETFTASLSQVMSFYAGQKSTLTNIYTDAKAFFQEATFPTDGLRRTLADVFGRLAGDAGCPAIHRLETAFGGGKTHTLIACIHLAKHGKKIAEVAASIIDAKILPQADEVNVVGIAGDEIAVHKPQGVKLIPYTLWGEIAFQIGGKEVYESLGETATSQAAPGVEFFEKVFGSNKVLVMLDELAQYAARLEAARPRGSDQLAAFLMTLHGYARTHAGISIILTLAGQNNAFSHHTERLKKTLSNVKGKDLSDGDAVSLMQTAEAGIQSVVARDSITVVPIQASEISRVLAKRLFQTIDQTSAKETSEAYRALYKRNVSLLPEKAGREDFIQAIAAHYPFHPCFIDFLNKKLATLETFQGTRGVLRVLSLAVRQIWERKNALSLIHTCHLDLRDGSTVNEIMGRTAANDLLVVLNTDVGGVETSQIEGGQSNAEAADRSNPHPLKVQMHEFTWRVVFLHSLVGRNLGLGTPLFGITKSDAILETTFPDFTPPQVETALKEIEKSAYYLRYHEARFYASTDPSVNIALAKVRRSLDLKEVRDHASDVSRRIIKTENVGFLVTHDVTLPEHVPDKKGRPLLGVVSLFAEPMNIETFITTCGPNRPRIEQNLVFIVSPQ